MSDAAMYVGITVYPEEVCRLFGVEAKCDFGVFRPTAAVAAELAARTSLLVRFVDKGVHVLGLEVPEMQRNYWAPARSVDECVALIQLRKFEWLREVARLKLDMRSVTLAHMEDKDEVVANPEPTLIIAMRQ